LIGLSPRQRSRGIPLENLNKLAAHDLIESKRGSVGGPLHNTSSAVMDHLLNGKASSNWNIFWMKNSTSGAPPPPPPPRFSLDAEGRILFMAA
jgi:hypothetical protein